MPTVHRLALFATGSQHPHSERRRAVLDEIEYPINDVSFHPTLPLLAVATGAYDGGFYHKGQLLLWDYEVDRCVQVFSESREVVRCEFRGSERLAVLLRPRYAGEFPDVDAVDCFVGSVLENITATRESPSIRTVDPRLSALLPIRPSAVGFDRIELYLAEHRARFYEAVRRLALDDRIGPYEERTAVRDVAWLDERTLAAVSDQSHLEVWRLDRHGDSTRVLRETGYGIGAQLLRSPSGWLVHVVDEGPPDTQEGDRSILLSLEEGVLTPWQTFDRVYVFSTDASGYLLGRDAGDPARARTRRDLVIAPGGSVVHEEDLGRYNSFSDYLRLDGGPALYFLGRVEDDRRAVFSLAPDGDASLVLAWERGGQHTSSSIGCLDGRSILRAYAVHEKRRPEQRWIERVDLETGASAWRSRVEHTVLALALVPDADAMIATTLDGALELRDTATGELLDRRAIGDRGIVSRGISCAVHGTNIAVGTADGRVLIYRLDP
jgi:WD40 repeat protein